MVARSAGGREVAGSNPVTPSHIKTLFRDTEFTVLEDNVFIFGSLSIVGVGFVKIPPQFYEKGPFYV